ncbi:ATP synthase F1 subunit epsilon [Buchnera aphidicola]|uniref:ATP synthase F1 subunit epsilon n=1 Tax=Buchnera aphidicola TaxID=9 RepID=UPI0034645B22
MKCYLNVVNTYNNFFSDYIKKIHINSISGELGIYSGHSPLLTIIQPGPLCIFRDNKKIKYFYISGGILEVQPDHISILSDIVINHDNLCFKKLLQEKIFIGNKIKFLQYSKSYKLKKTLLEINAKLKVLEIVKKYS